MSTIETSTRHEQQDLRVREDVLSKRSDLPSARVACNAADNVFTSAPGSASQMRGSQFFLETSSCFVNTSVRVAYK